MVVRTHSDDDAVRRFLQGETGDKCLEEERLSIGLVTGGLLNKVESDENAAVARVVISDGLNCRVEAVAKAHISELTLGAQDREVFEPARWYNNLRTWTWEGRNLRTQPDLPSDDISAGI